MGEFLDAFNAGVAERERINAKISPIELFATDPEGAAAEVIRRKRNLDSHVFDYATDFCVNCGQAHEHILDTFIACFGQPKVTAISHIARGSKLRNLMRSPSPWDNPPPRGAA